MSDINEAGRQHSQAIRHGQCDRVVPLQFRRAIELLKGGFESATTPPTAVATLGLVSEAARLVANHRVHVVPVVLALANPPWQRDVWLDPSAFEDLAHVFHTLFDDFCDADEPERYLGVSLRSDKEVVLMRELGAALNAAAAESPNDTDAEYLQASAWPEVVAIAGRLAQVMVANDLRELAVLLDDTAVPDPCQIARGTTGNSGEQPSGDRGSDTSPQVGSATPCKRP